MALSTELPGLRDLPDGWVFELHASGDFVSDVIRDTGDWYEREILDEIRDRVRGGVLVDVGAHIGNHAVFLAALVPNDGIHAFEPLPANVALLRRNVPPFGVWVHEVALSDREGFGWMGVDAGNLGHSRMGGAGPRVRVRTLDSYHLPDVTLLKIDVEGYEPQVLAGAADTIARCHPLIIIEDWKAEYGPLLPGYRVVAEWERAHQTFMYEWAA